MYLADVTVVIPTMCGGERAVEIQRAISSAKNQTKVTVDILIVVNGIRYDATLLQQIRTMDYVRVIQLDAPGISNARHHGRLYVQAPYFLMPDGDDELEPHALATMIEIFRRSPDSVGLVLADAHNTGYCSTYGFKPSPAEIERDPLSALIEQNWLILQSTLFKTQRVASELFDVDTRSNECTFIAFKICLAAVKVRVQEGTVAIIHNNAGKPSESKSDHFIIEEPQTIQQLLNMPVPRHIKKKLKAKLSRAHHAISAYYLRKGHIWQATKSHCLSLFLPGGQKNLLYTRHLIVAAFAK